MAAEQMARWSPCALLLVALGQQFSAATTTFNVTATTCPVGNFSASVNTTTWSSYVSQCSSNNSSSPVQCLTQPPQYQYTVLHTFYGTDGSQPLSKVVTDTQGNHYGTTQYGGVDGVGTVWRLAANGSYTVLHDFARHGTDGCLPIGIIIDSQGDLYGLTQLGGTGYDGGTLWRLTAAGRYSILHNFCTASVGCQPAGEPARDVNGNFYGVTSMGTAADDPSVQGTVWKLSADGSNFTTLYKWPVSGAQGAFPSLGAGVKLDTQGNILGVTWDGGAFGCGTVWKLSAGLNYSVLHHFNGTDGWHPSAEVILDRNDTIFGVTHDGGGPSQSGTIWQVSTDGSNFLVLHSFEFHTGYDPQGGMVLDSNNNLYGTTFVGGRVDQGVVWTLSADRSRYSVLHNFTQFDAGGTNPWAGLTMDSHGTLIGTAWSGGAITSLQDSFGPGTVWKLQPACST